jgi:hypothetical protein
MDASKRIGELTDEAAYAGLLTSGHTMHDSVMLALGLSTIQQRFALAYAETRDVTKASLEVGQTVAWGATQMRLPALRQVVLILEQQATMVKLLTRDSVLSEYLQIASECRKSGRYASAIQALDRIAAELGMGNQSNKKGAQPSIPAQSFDSGPTDAIDNRN